MSRRPAFIGLIATIAAWAWMFLTVHYNYGGNWTALYLIGPKTPVPASIASEKLYIFPNNSGYDGQSFHVMAHDPWMRRNAPAELEIDPFRYARILVPALAWMLAFGQDRWVDPAYFTVILASVFFGAYWMSLYTRRVSIHPAWGLTFLLSPATLTSLDRMLVDVTLAALCVAFVLCADREAQSRTDWITILILAAALLTRETAWILVVAYELLLLIRRRFKDAILTASAALPLIAWQLYIASRVGAFPGSPQVHSWIPLAGFFVRLTHLSTYDLPPNLSALAIAFDFVALAGMALAMGLALRISLSSFAKPESTTAFVLALFGYALSVVFLRGEAQWDGPYGFGRIFAPLPLLLAMYYLSPTRRIWLGLTPTLMVDSRIALNLGTQALGIVKGLLHWT